MDQPDAVAFDADTRVARILDIVAAETGVNRTLLRPDAKIDEIGITSLDMTLAVFKLETVFDVEIPVIAERTGSEFGTVSDLVRHVLSVLDHPILDQSAELPATA